MRLATRFLILYPSIPVIFALIAAIMVRWFAVPADRKRTEWFLVVATLIEPVSGLALALATKLTTLRPLKYDLFIYRIDAWFGEPSFVIGMLGAEHLWVRILISVSYGLISISVLGTFAAYLWLRPESESVALARTIGLNLFLAPIIYFLIPVSGPGFAFPYFPHLPLGEVVPHLIPIDAAPNGIPSVHMSTALLVLWFLRRWKWGLAVGLVFLALTGFATMGSGEHYFFDLLCAVPYATAVLWLGSKRWGRRVQKTEVAETV